MDKKVLILNDGTKYENWGIKACIDGLRNILKEGFDEENVLSLDHQFMHKLYDFEPHIFGRPLFLENSRIAKKFFKPFILTPKIADEFEYVAKEWMEGRGGKGADKFIAQAKGVDIVVFNAEGSTYRDNICGIRGLFMLWFAKNKLRKKTAFVNGSVTLTMVQAILPAMVRRVAQEIDMFAVREQYSKDSIVSFYPELEDKIQVFADSVFTLKKGESSAYQNSPFKNKPYFVFSFSMLPMDYSRSLDQSAVLFLIKALQQKIPNAVFLAKDSEDQILKDLAEKTGSYFVGPEYSYDDVMDILENALFLCSGRYHHLIFATMVGCPVIPLHTSSHKIFGLSEFFNKNMIKPIDPTDLWNTSEKIIKEADNILEGEMDLRDYYKNKARILGQESIRQVKIIADL